jgi:hypothetical protein
VSQSVWDLDESLSTPPHHPVSGKIEGDHGGGPVATGGAAAGGGLSIGGLNLGVIADLAVSLGTLAASIQRQQAAIDREARAIPGDYQFAASGVYPASGNLVLNLGSPDQGQYWLVRRIVVGGSDITTTPAGIGWVFVQGSPPNQNGANPPTASVADFTTGTFPQKAFYGTHQLVADETEFVYVVITAGTPGTLYVASLKAETYDRSSVRGSFEE